MFRHGPRARLRPGRYLLPLSDRWLLVALAPVPGVIVLGLFLDGALVELVDDPLDVLGYLRTSPAFVVALLFRAQHARREDSP
jgi:hypothetical protein